MEAIGFGKLIIFYFRGYIPREGKAIHRATVCPTGRREARRMVGRKREEKGRDPN